MNLEDKIKTFKTEFRHVGYVVKDIRSAAEKLTTVFPMMDPWKFCVCRKSESEVVDGRAVHFICGVSRVNGTTIELLEVMPDTPDCYHAEQQDWAAHVSYVYQDEEFDMVYEYLLANGYKVVFGAVDQASGEKCFYFEPVTGGPVLEFNNMFPGDPEYDSLEEALKHA